MSGKPSKKNLKQKTKPKNNKQLRKNKPTKAKRPPRMQTVANFDNEDDDEASNSESYDNQSGIESSASNNQIIHNSGDTFERSSDVETSNDVEILSKTNPDDDTKLSDSISQSQKSVDEVPPTIDSDIDSIQNSFDKDSEKNHDNNDHAQSDESNPSDDDIDDNNNNFEEGKASNHKNEQIEYTFYNGIEEGEEVMRFWIDITNKSSNDLTENGYVKLFWANLCK